MEVVNHNAPADPCIQSVMNSFQPGIDQPGNLAPSIVACAFKVAGHRGCKPPGHACGPGRRQSTAGGRELEDGPSLVREQGGADRPLPAGGNFSRVRARFSVPSTPQALQLPLMIGNPGGPRPAATGRRPAQAVDVWVRDAGDRWRQALAWRGAGLCGPSLGLRADLSLCWKRTGAELNRIPDSF